jgi:DNA-binding transcriptional LysR family regulator
MNLTHERLNGITTFVLAAEAGSFAQAAERLGVTRSAVGKSIARIEQRLGARLFHRTTRRQSLTDDGQAYYERCVRALAELEAAEAAFDTGRREPTGRLRLSAPVLFGRHCVVPALLGLARRHPQLQIEMSFNDRVVDLLEEGYDLAVRVGALPDSTSLAARRLGTQRMAICASPDYLARHGRPGSVAALAAHVGIVYGREGRRRHWLVRDADGRVHEVRIDNHLCFDDLQAIADAAVAGIGLAWLPCWQLARHVRAGELELVMDCERVLSAEIHAVWPQTRWLPSRTRVAIDALAAEIPALLG